MGIQAGGRGVGEGAATSPQFQKSLKYFGQKNSGENIVKGSQDQVSKLLSLTFALSKRSKGHPGILF